VQPSNFGTPVVFFIYRVFNININRELMKSFLKKREIRITRRQAVIAAIAVVVLVAIYWFVTHRPAPAPDLPVVAVEPVIQDDVEIYGEYVGRVRAQ
jgi:membrane fusion protein (multidrug efflux system)